MFALTSLAVAGGAKASGLEKALGQRRDWESGQAGLFNQLQNAAALNFQFGLWESMLVK